MGNTNITRRLGDNVLYRLSEQDVREIIQKRRTAGIATASGNDPHEGDVYPAIIVRDWADPDFESGRKRNEKYRGEGVPNEVVDSRDYVDSMPVNLQVFLDGNDVFWATSRILGYSKGQWNYASVVYVDDQRAREID
jgi:hypothetical protein